MSTSISIFVALLAVGVSTPVRAEQAQQILGEMTTIRGVVEAVDYRQRVLTMKESGGKFTSIRVPAGRNSRFDEVKVGDGIQLRYYDVVSARVKPANEPAVDTSSTTSTPATDGRLGVTMATQRTITATITAIELSARSVTFSGPAGFSYSRRASDSTDLEALKVGDRIDVTWTEAVQIAINP